MQSFETIAYAYGMLGAAVQSKLSLKTFGLFAENKPPGIKYAL